MPSLERMNKGSDADIRVAAVEWRKVTGVIEKGNVHEGSDLRVERMLRGGWVEGVSKSLVRAISSGASITPAMPAAETATAKEESGDGEDSMSSPPVCVYEDVNWKERPGSGKARRAEMKERANDVIVERRME